MTSPASRLAFLLLILAGPARAQSVLLATANNHWWPVQAVRDGTPYVRRDGRLQPAGADARFVLHKAPLYRDGFIQLEDFKFTVSHLVYGSSDVNYTITLTGNLTSSQALEDCFLAFEMLADGNRPAEIGTIGLPRLPAGKKIGFRVELSLTGPPREDHYRLHFFSAQGECRNSRMPPDFQDRTQARDLADTANRAPRPYLAVAPAYPEALRPQAPAGSATIRCHIGIDGAVAATTVMDASDPEFGRAAGVAASEWLFAPAVANHRYVESAVDVPFAFKAPGPRG